jgi:hypothetical protein
MVKAIQREKIRFGILVGMRAMIAGRSVDRIFTSDGKSLRSLGTTGK